MRIIPELAPASKDLTIRQYFVAAALQGLISASGRNGIRMIDETEIGAQAVSLADEAIKAEENTVGQL